MPLLDFEDAKPSKPRKKMRMLLGVGTIAAVVGFGATFASSISLNGGDNVEFGQGVATTAACDSSIKITPVSEFTNSDASASPSPAAARLPMTVIKIEGVDLTPEGWNQSLNDNEGGFDPSFHPSIDPEQRYWDSEHKDRAGKYYNGTSWVPTCEGKVLLLRAYTNNPDYGSYTVDSTTDSPLWLNVNPGVSAGPFGMVPASATEVNAGVGVRLYFIASEFSELPEGFWVTDVFLNDGGFANATALDPIEPGPIENVSNVSTEAPWVNGSLEIRLRTNLYSGPLRPVDSRLVDKITIESTGKSPLDWYVDYDWRGSLGQLP